MTYTKKKQLEIKEGKERKTPGLHDGQGRAWTLCATLGGEKRHYRLNTHRLLKGRE